MFFCGRSQFTRAGGLRSDCQAAAGENPARAARTIVVQDAVPPAFDWQLRDQLP
jgi:hypothetical protein